MKEQPHFPLGAILLSLREKKKHYKNATLVALKSNLSNSCQNKVQDQGLTAL